MGKTGPSQRQFSNWQQAMGSQELKPNKFGDQHIFRFFKRKINKTDVNKFVKEAKISFKEPPESDT